MEKAKVSQEQLNQLVTFTALLYYHLAKEIVDSFGQEGEKAIARAMKAFGQERGKAIRAKVEEEQLPLTLENLARFYDLPINLAWRVSARISPRQARHTIEFCPFADLWQKRKANKLGLLYCQVEEALTEAYNPEMETEQAKSLLAGQECCLRTVKMKERKR